MVKPPVVFLAGLLRQLRRGIDGEYWIWYSEGAGQRLFYPPDVSGWDDSRWLDTSTIRGRFDVLSRALSDYVLEGDAVDDYDETETPEAAVAAARAWAGDPGLTSETVGLLTAFAADALAGRRRLAAQHLPRPAPERAAPPDPRLPRLPDELTMANCGCNDYSRTQLLRRAAAEAGEGLPAIEPGMPLPAGTGLTRRSFVSRATGLALSVYGAAEPGPEGIRAGHRGGCRAGAGLGPHPRVDLPLGRRRLAHGAGADERPSAVRELAAEPRARGGRRGPRSRRIRRSAGTRRWAGSPSSTARAR